MDIDQTVAALLAIKEQRGGMVDSVTLQRSADQWAGIPVFDPDGLAACRLESLDDLTRWLDSLGGRIHTYSLRGIALAAWEQARGANAAVAANVGSAATSTETERLRGLLLQACSTMRAAGLHSEADALASKTANA